MTIALLPAESFVRVRAEKYFPSVVSVALALWGWQLALHVWQPASSGDLRLWFPHGVAWLHDALLLTTVALVASRLGRSGWWLLLMVGAGLSIYPQLLRQHLVMQTNLFATDAAAASTFLVDYLGIEHLWPAIGATIVGLMARTIHPLRITNIFIISVVVIMAGAFLTLPRSPHPLVSSVWQQATALLSGSKRVVPSLQAVATKEVTSVTTTTPRIFDKVGYRHVFLIVLEGIPAADFEHDFLQREDGYHHHVKSQATYFDNYRSTNLDSYTSLIAMITGRQVPYRAYADPSSYEHINLGDNLTRTLRANGYHSTFLSTYAHQPFVPTHDDWNTVLDRNDLHIGDQWLTLGNTRMEEAVENNRGQTRIYLEQSLRAACPVSSPTARIGAVAFIHRFGALLNLHVHFHCVVVDGVFEGRAEPGQPPQFHPASALTTEQLAKIQNAIRRRLLRALTRRGLLEPEDAKEMATWDHGGGFSLDVGTRIEADDREGLERLLRYCARPALALERLRQLDAEHLVYESVKPGPGGEMRIVAFITEAPAIREILGHLGEPSAAPPLAPARGPPLWEWSSASQWETDPQVQPAPDYEFDQRIAW